jgi:hypothetical protein
MTFMAFISQGNKHISKKRVYMLEKREEPKYGSKKNVDLPRSYPH